MHFGRFPHARRLYWPGALLFCLVLVTPLQAAHIDPPNPGAFPPDLFVGCAGCIFKASLPPQTQLSSNGDWQAILNTAVFFDPNPIPLGRVGPGLDFFYQLTNVGPVCGACTSGPIDIARFTVTDFSEMIIPAGVDLGINVGAVPGFVSLGATAIPGTVDRVPPNGDTVGWSYDTPGSIALAPGTTSVIMEVATTATNYAVGTGNALVFGAFAPAAPARVGVLAPSVPGTATFNAFTPAAPIPEPATMLLIAAGMLALGLIRDSTLNPHFACLSFLRSASCVERSQERSP